MHRLAHLLLVLALVIPSAWAAPTFAPVPCLGSQQSSLQIQVIRYEGGVHGKMVVQVRNAGPLPETFTAAGLYFVPTGQREQPPQREGAAGPFVVVGNEQRRSVNSVVVRGGERLRLELQTFCLDAHRPSPDPGQSFTVATRRLPADLRGGIESGTQDILRRTCSQGAAIRAGLATNETIDINDVDTPGAVLADHRAEWGASVECGVECTRGCAR